MAIWIFAFGGLVALIVGTFLVHIMCDYFPAAAVAIPLVVTFAICVGAYHVAAKVDPEFAATQRITRCVACDNKIDYGDNFCPECGTRVKE